LNFNISINPRKNDIPIMFIARRLQQGTSSQLRFLSAHFLFINVISTYTSLHESHWYGTEYSVRSPRRCRVHHRTRDRSTIIIWYEWNLRYYAYLWDYYKYMNARSTHHVCKMNSRPPTRYGIHENRNKLW